MLVRYIVETHGERVPLKIVTSIADGSSTGEAILSATGSSYEHLETNFSRWLANWEDPERAGLPDYVEALSALASEEREIRGKRNEANREWSDKFDRIKYEKATIGFRDASKDLRDRAEALTPPPVLRDLHGIGHRLLRCLQ